jgi:vitamin K-dependent gamma-carboxylase
MVVAALVMFPPDWPRRLGAILAKSVHLSPGRPGRGSPTGEAILPVVRPIHPIGVALATCHCVLQLALPLRHLAYPGDVRWHEQGMRFSWRVMVREKNGSVTFAVKELRTGRVSLVPPRQYLNRVQEREMSAQPDLILQLAHHVRSDFERRGLGPVEVAADALASLNGRPAHRLVDPSADLGAERDGLRPFRWILDAPSGPPPRLGCASASHLSTSCSR